MEHAPPRRHGLKLVSHWLLRRYGTRASGAETPRRVVEERGRGSLPTIRMSGERRNPHRGVGQISERKEISAHFELASTHAVTNTVKFLYIFVTNKNCLYLKSHALQGLA